MNGMSEEQNKALNEHISKKWKIEIRKIQFEIGIGIGIKIESEIEIALVWLWSFCFIIVIPEYRFPDRMISYLEWIDEYVNRNRNSWYEKKFRTIERKYDKMMRYPLNSIEFDRNALNRIESHRIELIDWLIDWLKWEWILPIKQKRERWKIYWLRYKNSDTGNWTPNYWMRTNRLNH